MVRSITTTSLRLRPYSPWREVADPLHLDRIFIPTLRPRNNSFLLDEQTGSFIAIAGSCCPVKPWPASGQDLPRSVYDFLPGCCGYRSRIDTGAVCGRRLPNENRTSICKRNSHHRRSKRPPRRLRRRIGVNGACRRASRNACACMRPGGRRVYPGQADVLSSIMLKRGV